MNQMNTLKMTSLQGRLTMGGFLSQANENTDNSGGGGQIIVDEMVFDSNSGTFATFQDPPVFVNLLNNNDGACSYIV